MGGRWTRGRRKRLDRGFAYDGRVSVGAGLRGQKVLVVGTGAMALATVTALARADARVTVASRDLERASAVAAKTDGSVEPIVCDPENAADVERMMSQLAALDHVVMLAGGTGANAGSIPDTPVDAAQRAFGRLWASYNVLQSGSRHVREEGSITLLSGSSSRRGVAGLGVWGTLHGSIEALARAAALELSPVRSTRSARAGSGSQPTGSSPRIAVNQRTSLPPSSHWFQTRRSPVRCSMSTGASVWGRSVPDAGATIAGSRVVIWREFRYRSRARAARPGCGR